MRKCYLTDESRQKGREKTTVIQKQQYENRLKVYADNPKRCTYCQTSVPYEKRQNDYCSHSCAAKVNNRGIRRNVVEGTYAAKPCAFCNKSTTNKHFCNVDCYSAFVIVERTEQIESSGTLLNYVYDKKYLIEKRGHQCEQCQTGIWQNQPVPLVLDHIDGNSDNNALTNVRLLCQNCNALTPTFCGKNIGNGRSRRKKYRNERYSNGESY